MDLTQYVRILRRRWRLFVAVVLVCVAGAAVSAFVQTPVYQTTAVLVVTTGSSTTATSSQPSSADDASTIAQFATTPPVQDTAVSQAAQASGLTARQPEQVTAVADSNTPFLRITVSDRDARWAQAVANSYVTAMPVALSGIDPVVASSAQQVTVLTKAPLPGSPANPNKRLYLLVGLGLGLVFAAGIVVLRESLDRRVHGIEELPPDMAGALLGAVPDEATKAELVVGTILGSPKAEAYRSVQANLAFGSPDGLPRSLLFTSPDPNDGVTTVAANVALALANSGRSVVLIDANLRHPRLHELFGIPAAPGLAEVLTGTSDVSELLHQVPDTSLRVLAAGSAQPRTHDLLTRREAADLLEKLQQEAEVVVLDSPPLLTTADAKALAAQTHNVVLTVCAGRTAVEAAQSASDAVRQVGGRLVGVVLNRAPAARPARRVHRGRRHALEPTSGPAVTSQPRDVSSGEEPAPERLSSP